MRRAEAPRVPLAEPEPPSGAQGCAAEARPSAIFSIQRGAGPWVRGGKRGTCFSFFSDGPLGIVSTPVTRQIRHRGQRPEKGWKGGRPWREAGVSCGGEGCGNAMVEPG